MVRLIVEKSLEIDVEIKVSVCLPLDSLSCLFMYGSTVHCERMRCRSKGVCGTGQFPEILRDGRGNGFGNLVLLR